MHLKNAFFARRVGARIYPEISVEISGKFQSRRGNQEKCGTPIGIQKFFHSHKRFLSLQRFYSGNRIFPVNCLFKGNRMKARILQCITKLKAKNFDAILISHPINVTYLTGFRKAEGYLLVSRNTTPVYFTNFLYQYEAQKLKNCRVLISNGNIFELIKNEIIRLHLKNVSFEAKHLPYLEYEKFSNDLAVAGINFLKTIDFVESVRAIKAASEISLIKKSVKISQEAFEFASEIYSSKMSEKDLSTELEKFLKMQGDGELAFHPIVAYGRNSAVPHHIPQATRLDKNFFLIDLGSKCYGYCADLTRVFFWGKMPPLFKKIYRLVLRAQELSISKIKDGVKAKEVDLAAREFLHKHGLGKFFGHGLGHGIGLAVHESPFLNSKNEEVLKEGMVVTVEPAVYLNGKFGIRIEDMVLVGKNKGEILSCDFKRRKIK